MINAIIIDDEKNNINNLIGLLEKHCPKVNVIATATSAVEGRNIIGQYHPHLVFLDIQMPGENGLELLQKLDLYNFEIIFVTAYDQYGIQAVKFSAIDYLLKPVDIIELTKAVDKVESRQREKKANSQLENLIEFLKNKQEQSEHRLALPTAKETRFIHPSNIIRCESLNAYTSFYLTDGSHIMVSRPIFEYDELLKEYGFIRCHQSHLVNKKFIKSWVKEEGGYLILENGTHVPISRNKKETLSKALLFLKK